MFALIMALVATLLYAIGKIVFRKIKNSSFPLSIKIILYIVAIPVFGLFFIIGLSVVFLFSYRPPKTI